MTQEQAERFAHLFRGREDAHGVYGDHPDPKKRSVSTVRAPVTLEKFKAHLEGRGPYLGVIPIDTDNLCHWGAIDIDDDGVDLVLLEIQAREKKLPLVVCRSKSGGAHLYLFTRDPVPAKMMREKLEACKLALGRSKNHDGRATEIFPKQDKVVREDDLGNWINLPYYHAEDTNRYAVINGSPAALEKFLDYASGLRLSREGLEAFHPGGQEYADAPPCLQTLWQLGEFGEGGRNNLLFNWGVYFRLSRPDDWEDMVQDFNAEVMDPPLPDREVAMLIRSLERKDYGYTCAQLPINAHCNKTACKKRKYGIQALVKREVEKNFPEMSGLRKVLTDPPRWILAVDGQDLDLVTDELMNLMKFRRVALEKANILIPYIKGGDWDDKVRDLLEEVQVIEAPEDAGTLGMFQALVSRFLQFRDKAASWDDVLAGRPFQPAEEDKMEGVLEDRVYFRSQDLANFLDRQKFREYTMAKIWSTLSSMGADRAEKKIKGTFVRMWSIPSSYLDGLVPTEPLEVPEDTEPTY